MLENVRSSLKFPNYPGRFPQPIDRNDPYFHQKEQLQHQNIGRWSALAKHIINPTVYLEAVEILELLTDEQAIRVRADWPTENTVYTISEEEIDGIDFLRESG